MRGSDSLYATGSRSVDLLIFFLCLVGMIAVAVRLQVYHSGTSASITLTWVDENGGRHSQPLANSLQGVHPSIVGAERKILKQLEEAPPPAPSESGGHFEWLIRPADPNLPQSLSRLIVRPESDP